MIGFIGIPVRFLLGSPYTRSLYDSLHEITKPTPPVTAAPQTNAESFAPENMDAVSFDPRVAKTCKKFLEKVISFFLILKSLLLFSRCPQLQKIEADLTEES